MKQLAMAQVDDWELELLPEWDWAELFRPNLRIVTIDDDEDEEVEMDCFS